MTYSGRFSADQKPTIPLVAISEFNVHISLFLRRLLLASGCLLSLNTSLWAQSNFIPLKRETTKNSKSAPLMPQFLKSVAPTDSAIDGLTRIRSQKPHQVSQMPVHSPLSKI